MTHGNARDRDIKRLLGVEPEQLSREELIALIRNLQQAVSGEAQQPAPVRVREPVPAPAGSGPDYTILFDGGSLGNPGLGYGSFEISGRNVDTFTAQELEFGHNMTNNQAEFQALIAALEQLLAFAGQHAGSSSVAIRGDSQLVIRGLKGEWRIKNPGLQPLYRRASDLLREFGSVDLAWHPRMESVRTFGH